MLQTWMDSLKGPIQQKMDMKFGTWNVWSLYRTGSLKAVASELAKCKLDPVAVQETRCNNAGSEPADDYTPFSGNQNANNHLGTGPFIHQGIRSAFKRVKYISNSMFRMYEYMH
jgi:exonuclease III